MVVSVLIALLGYLAAIAAGVGMWFLARYIWRSMVDEMPDNGFVQWGLGLAPIVRKALAGVACVLVSVVLMAAWTSWAGSRSSDTEDQASRQVAASTQENGTSKKDAKDATRIAVFSDVSVEVTNEEGTDNVVVKVAGTVANAGTGELKSLRMPPLDKNGWGDCPSMEKEPLEPGESTTFAYEATCRWDEDCTWAFGECKTEYSGLDGVTKEIEQKLAENREVVAAAREEAAQRAAEEAEQRKAEEEQRRAERGQKHLESSCWVTPSGSNYHEDSSCYLMHGSTNLTEMTVQEARDWGYDPCDHCAH